jgi:hypothetical protein
MDSVSVNQNDIDALAQALDAGTLPAGDLLRALVAAIRAVSGDQQPVTVSVEAVTAEGSLGDVFDAAFTPEPAPAAPGVPAAGQQVHVRVMKITR